MAVKVFTTYIHYKGNICYVESFHVANCTIYGRSNFNLLLRKQINLSCHNTSDNGTKLECINGIK